MPSRTAIIAVIVIFTIIAATIITMMIYAGATGTEHESPSMTAFNSIIRRQKISGGKFTDPAMLEAIADYDAIVKRNPTNPVAIPEKDCPADAPVGGCSIYYNNITVIPDQPAGDTSVRIPTTISGGRIGGEGWEGIADFSAIRMVGANAERDDNIAGLIKRGVIQEVPRTGTLTLTLSWGDRVQLVYVIITPSSGDPHYFIIDVGVLDPNSPEWLNAQVAVMNKYGTFTRNAYIRYRTDAGILTYEYILSPEEAIAPFLTVSALPVVSMIREPWLLNKCDDGACYGASYTIRV